MGMLEVAIWSAALGGAAPVIFISLGDLVLLRTRAAAAAFAYNCAALLFLLLHCGLPQLVLPDLDPQSLRLAQVLAVMACMGGGNLGIRAWLAARARDRVMSIGLLVTGVVAPSAALACLLLPPVQQLPAVAMVCLANTGIVTWLVVRAWLLGDAQALGMVIAHVFLVPTVAGLYAVAMGLPGLDAAWHAGIALCAVAYAHVIAFTLWRRNWYTHRKLSELVPSRLDPVTRLPGSAAFVHELLRAQKRRRRTQRDGALLAVLLFDPQRIQEQVGPSGLHEAYLHLAQRLQREVGVVNAVGRYWERCFVAMVETVASPAAVRTLGLRVAASLRKPVEVGGPNGEPQAVRLDIGVGVIHLGRQHLGTQVEDLLHEAQDLAEAARAMRSRAAMREPGRAGVIPAEYARLDRRRNGRSGFGPSSQSPSDA